MATEVPAPTFVLPQAEPPLWRAAPIAVLRGHEERVWCVAWHPTAPILASCSADRTVRLWCYTHPLEHDVQDPSATRMWRCVQTLEGEHTGTVRRIAWSPSGEYLACASFDKTVTVWRRSPSEGIFQVESVLDGHESEVKGVAWATDSTLATCARDRNVWIWDRIDEGEFECAGILTGHLQDVKCCVWVMPPHGRSPLVVSCGYDDTIRVWEESERRDDWHCAQTISHHAGTVWGVSVQPLEQELFAGGHDVASAGAMWPLLCSCSDDKTVVLWARDTSGKYASVATASGVSERSVYAAEWGPGASGVIACACGDNSIAFLAAYQEGLGRDRHVHLRTVASVPSAHESDVNSVAFCATTAGLVGADGQPLDGLLLASAGDDHVVRLWHVQEAR